MADPLEEFLRQLPDRLELASNEEATKLGAILPVLAMLGWNTSDKAQVEPEFPVRKGQDTVNDRVDFCLKAGPAKVFLEAKKADERLDSHEERLSDYAFRYGVELAVLTNGFEWRLFMPTKSGPWGGRRFAVIDVHRAAGAAQQLSLFLSRQSVADGSALQDARVAFVEKALSDAWAAVRDKHCDEIVEWLATEVRAISGYDPDRARLERYVEEVEKESSAADSPARDAPPPSSSNPFQSGSRFGQCYDALLNGLPKEGGLEKFAAKIGIDPANARRALAKGYGGVGDLGRWRLVVEGDTERLVPQPPEATAAKSDRVMQILQDGGWHTAPELRKKLGTKSINSVLKSLRDQGLVELREDSQRGNAVRSLPGAAQHG
jgi:hypothetical protein